MPYHHGTRNGRTSMGRSSNRTRTNRRTPSMNGRNSNGYSNGSVMSNLTANSGQYVNERTGQPYTGPMHMHSGRAMVGAEHSSQPHDYLTQVNGNNGGNSHGGMYFYEDTGQPYSGHIVNVGGVMYSTPDGVYSGHSRPLVQRTTNGHTNTNMSNGMRRSPSRRRGGTRRTSTSMAARTPMRNRTTNMRNGNMNRANMASMGRRRGSTVSNRRRTPASVRTVRRTPMGRNGGGY